MARYDLGPWTLLGRVTTLNEGGIWNSAGLIGDTFMERIGDKYRFLWHGPGSGLYYSEKDADGDPRTGWPAVGLVNPVPIALPIPSTVAEINIDTPCIYRDPASGDFTVLHTATPGSRPSPSPPNQGWINIVQRLVSAAPSKESAAWTRDLSEVLIQTDPAAPWEGPWSFVEGPNITWRGGIDELSCFWEPRLERFVLFYDGFMIDEPDEEGQTHRHRLGRMTSVDGVTWQRDPPASATSWVWDADDEPRGVWGDRHQPHHFAVTRGPNGIYYLAMLGGLRSANVGEGNKTTAIGLWWSREMGAKGSWKAFASNPIVTKDMLGFPLPYEGNQLGSPNLFFDPPRGKVYLQFDAGGAPNWKRYQAGASPYLAEAEMPSRRDLLLDAVVTQIETISVAAGFNNNIDPAEGGGGAQEADGICDQFGLLPTVLVSIPSENQIEQLETLVTKRVDFVLLAAPLHDGSTKIERLIDDLVEDLERVLLAQAWIEPVLGVPGADELQLHGHDKLPVDGDRVDGAAVAFTVQYRHNVTDPRAYP